MTRKALNRARRRFNAERRIQRHHMAAVIGMSLFGRKVRRPLTFAQYTECAKTDRVMASLLYSYVGKQTHKKSV